MSQPYARSVPGPLRLRGAHRCLATIDRGSSTIVTMSDEAPNPYASGPFRSSSRSPSRRCCSAGVYPPRCAYRMPWSYSGSQPTSRPELYEFILVSIEAGYDAALKALLCERNTCDSGASSTFISGRERVLVRAPRTAEPVAGCRPIGMDQFSLVVRVKMLG